MFRSMRVSALAALLCAAACTTPTTPVADPCAKVYAVTDLLLKRQNDRAAQEAFVTHVVEHPDCFSAKAVADAQMALVGFRRPVPASTWTYSGSGND